MIRVKNPGVLLVALLVQNVTATRMRAEEKESKPADKPAEATATPPKQESSVTDHSTRIGGQTIPYKATAATTPIKNDKDEPTALIYYTAYTRSDVKDMSQRPVSFLYTGGPGSASVRLHMGSLGPRRVVTVNADVTPPAPYKLVDNPDCLLDKSDLVFIDPVGTGFSRAVGTTKAWRNSRKTSPASLTRLPNRKAVTLPALRSKPARRTPPRSSTIAFVGRMTTAPLPLTGRRRTTRQNGNTCANAATVGTS